MTILYCSRGPILETTPQLQHHRLQGHMFPSPQYEISSLTTTFHFLARTMKFDFPSTPSPQSLTYHTEVLILIPDPKPCNPAQTKKSNIGMHMKSLEIKYQARGSPSRAFHPQLIQWAVCTNKGFLKIKEKVKNWWKGPIF